MGKIASVNKRWRGSCEGSVKLTYTIVCRNKVLSVPEITQCVYVRVGVGV